MARPRSVTPWHIATAVAMKHRGLSWADVSYALGISAKLISARTRQAGFCVPGAYETVMTDEVRPEAVLMLAEGLSFKEVAHILNVQLSTLYYSINQRRTK